MKHKISSSENYQKEDLLRARLDLDRFSEFLGYKNAPHQTELYQYLRDPRHQRILAIWPPGHGKSTCATVNYPIWEVGRDHNLRFIIASHSREFVESFIREITARIESDQYRTIFGDLKPERPKIWTKNELVVERPNKFSKDPTFTALSTGSPIIGRRADRIICDDIIDETVASSESMRQGVRNWFKKELLTRLEPNGRLIVIGTRWHFLDLYSELLKEETYVKLVHPAIQSDGSALWPDRWPLELLMARRKELGSIAFSGQYLCNPTPAEGAVFKAEWLHYWHPTSEDPANRIYKLPPRENMRIFQGWDLAISEDPSADWTAGVTIGLDQDGYVWVLDYYRNHIDFPTQIKQVEAEAANWKPEKIVIESNAYQRALPQWLRQGKLPVVEMRQTKNKLLRLLELTPYFENGKIRIKHGMDDLTQEYLQFPKGNSDDLLDALHLAFSPAKEPPLVVQDLFDPPSPYDMPPYNTKTLRLSERKNFSLACR